MEIGVYDIINDPLPMLHEIKTINVAKTNFSSDNKIVNVLNKELMMDKMDSEYVYALALSFDLTPRGIILVGIGNNQKHLENIRGLGIGLLLTGAEQFMVFHNHPGGNKNISKSDKILSKKYHELGDTIGIDFIRHIMITKNYFDICEEEWL